MITNSRDSYGLVSKFLHWAMALLILGLIGVGLYMTGMADDDPLRGQIYSLHKATGVLVLMLAVLRILWLRVSHGPDLPAALLRWEQVMFRVVTGLMYLLMLLVPLSGYLLSNSAGYGVSFFGLFDLPTLVSKNETLHDIAGEAHELMSYGLLGLVGLHVLGSLKHRFLDNNPETDVLKRML